MKAFWFFLLVFLACCAQQDQQTTIPPHTDTICQNKEGDLPARAKKMSGEQFGAFSAFMGSDMDFPKGAIGYVLNSELDGEGFDLVVIVVNGCAIGEVYPFEPAANGQKSELQTIFERHST